jgi:hypothetical protein
MKLSRVDSVPSKSNAATTRSGGFWGIELTRS